MNVTPIAPSRVPAIWPLVFPLLQPAIEVPLASSTPDDVLRNLCLGQTLLWAIHEADRLSGAAVTQITNFPKYRALSCIYMGGQTMNDWYDEAERVIGEWAKAQGCTVFEAVVRRGLVRKLSRFTDLGTLIRREI